MEPLLVIFLLTVASAVAIDEHEVWTEDMVNEILVNADMSDAHLTLPQLIEKYGFNGEIHRVVTEDGYILTMHRISGSRASPPAKGKPVVFLMHGLLSSATDWVIMGPGKSLGYLLADAGYDVWMGNARGTKYSKNHTTIEDIKSKEYWHFDWHEIGYYDLPAMIDYTLAATNKEKLVYVGHSQGTTVFYVMASERPQYNDKIKVSFSLAPIAYMGHAKSPVLRVAAKHVNILETLFKLFGANEFLPSSTLITVASGLFCNDDALTQFLCSNALFLLCGFNKAQLNTTMLPVNLAHAPAGASTRQLVHYGQEVNSGKFRWWDHGIIRNLVIYRSRHPPNYDLSKITSPTHLLYSDNDWMADVGDVEQLWSELGNATELYRVLDGKWSHLDFLWGINAKELVYDHILATLAKKYNTQ